MGGGASLPSTTPDATSTFLPKAAAVALSAETLKAVEGLPEAAKTEIIALRKFAKNFQDQLKGKLQLIGTSSLTTMD